MDFNPTSYSKAWKELANTLQQKEVENFFDESFHEMRRFYEKVGHPNGEREEDFWEWMKEELFNAHKRSLKKQEEVIRALQESVQKNHLK